MLYVGDATLIKYLESKDKIDYENLLNEKRYTVKDSNMSYRQANSMDEDSMLPNDPERKQGWRKFSLKELIYIELILDLKKFGLQHSQLRDVRHAFFREPNEPVESSTGKIVPHKLVIEEVLGYVLGHVEMIMSISPTGELVFYAPGFFTLMYPRETFIFVNINNIVNRVLRRFSLPEFTPKWTLSTESHALYPSEVKALSIIRKQEYKTIEITKKDGEINIVRAEGDPEENKELTEQEVLALLHSGEYLNINITKRDGKLVKVSKKDTYKI